jgi:hypothetical protein
MRKYMWSAPEMDWERILDWGLKKLKGEGLRVVMRKLIMGVSVYHIWLQRKNRIFGGQVKSEESIMNAILWDVKHSVFSKMGLRILC